MTGVSQVSFPWSTSLASMSVVIALVLDATMKRVLRVHLLGAAQLAGAEAVREDDLPVLDQADARRRGRRCSCMAAWTNRPARRSRAWSSRCAFLPAKDSRVYPLGRSSP